MSKKPNGGRPQINDGLAKTGAERASEHAERMKKAGMVKVSVSAWVPQSQADRCKSAAKQAISEALKNNLK